MSCPTPPFRTRAARVGLRGQRTDSTAWASTHTRDGVGFAGGPEIDIPCFRAQQITGVDISLLASSAPHELWRLI